MQKSQTQMFFKEKIFYSTSLIRRQEAMQTKNIPQNQWKMNF